MIRTMWRTLTLAMLLAVTVLALPSCGLTEGMNPLKWDPITNTSRFRVEYEYIPNAVVMRMDTQPDWELGRYVFQRGADNLLVVSRITSWSTIATKQERNSGKDIPGMKDHIVERVWITIPQGTPLGQQLDLGELEYRFMVNYDASDADTAPFVRPFRVAGKLRVLDVRPANVTVHLDMNVTPSKTTDWKVDSDLRVPVTPNGVRAWMPPAYATVVSVARPGEGLDTPATQPDLTPATAPAPTATQPATVLVVPPASQPASTQPTAMDVPPGTQPAGTQPAADSRSITGKWWSRDAGWEFRLQIDGNGTFVESDCRVGYEPGNGFGTWRFKDNNLVLIIKHYQFGGKDATGDLGNHQYCVFHSQMQSDGTMTLDGPLPRPENKTHFVFHRADFPDMNMVPPPWYDDKSIPPDAPAAPK